MSSSSAGDVLAMPAAGYSTIQNKDARARLDLWLSSGPQEKHALLFLQHRRDLQLVTRNFEFHVQRPDFTLRTLFGWTLLEGLMVRLRSKARI